MQRTTVPIDVRLMSRQELPEAIGVCGSDTSEVQDLRDHQKHDEAAIGIHRCHSLGDRSLEDGFDREPQCSTIAMPLRRNGAHRKRVHNLASLRL